MEFDTIFLHAVSISDAAERSRYLNDACGGDSELRRQIDTRLKTHPRESTDETLISDSHHGDLNPDDNDSKEFEPTLIGTDVSSTGEITNDSIPAEIPGYEMFGEIARGGMGIVLHGRERKLDRDVAVKILKPGRKSPEAAARFSRESRVVAKLAHPCIPPVYALGELPDGAPFLVMKLIRGRTLRAMLESRDSPKVDQSRFLQIFAQISQAVGYAHSVGIVHRDVKPANVMVGEFGEVQVMDWGIARILQDPDFAPDAADSDVPGQQGTRVGTIMGSPTYMAPEQARGEPVDARADVYSLGAILSVILTGKAPFDESQSAEDIIRLTASGKIESVLQQLDSCGADAELIALAKRCLSSSVEERPADAQKVAMAVAAHRAAVEQRLQLAEQTRAASDARLQEQRKRRKTMFVAASMVFIALAAGIAVSIDQLVKTSRARQEAEIERDKAGRRYQIAIDAFSDMVFPMQEKLTARNGTLEIRKELLNTARDGLGKLLVEAEKQGNADQTLAWSSIQMGNIETALGHFDSARKEFQSAHETALRLVNADPQNLVARSILHQSLDSLGNEALLRKDADPAREYFQTKLTAISQLAEADPTNVDLQREIGLSYGRMSEVSLLQGNTTEALEFANKRRQIAQTLSEADRGNTLLKSELARSQESLGRAAGYANQRDLALSSYTSAMEINDQLLQGEPNNILWQRAMATNLTQLGHLREDLGQIDAASKFYQQAVIEWQKLAEGDPQNVNAQLDLFSGYHNIAYCQAVAHEHDVALETLLMARAIVLPLHEQHQLIGQFSHAVADTDQQIAQRERCLRAVASLDGALAEPSDVIPELLQIRLIVLARKSDGPGLTATAKAFSDLAATSLDQCFSAARAWAVAFRFADSEERQNECGEHALALLKQVPLDEGKLQEARTAFAERIQANPDFVALSRRRDFQDFLSSLIVPQDDKPTP